LFSRNRDISVAIFIVLPHAEVERRKTRDHSNRPL
jgi:hypothetical protein